MKTVTYICKVKVPMDEKYDTLRNILRCTSFKKEVISGNPVCVEYTFNFISCTSMENFRSTLEQIYGDIKDIFSVEVIV